MMIEVIVFDLGGVIVNVNFNSALGMLFDNSGKLNAALPNYLSISNLMQEYETGKIGAPDFHERLVDHLGLELSFEDFITSSNEAIEPGEDGIESIVRSLGEEYRLAILSNTNPIHFEHIKKKYAMIGLFEHIILSYEIGVMKPAVLAYEKLIAATSKSPLKLLFIDDRIENINAAKELGIDGIHYRSVENLRRELEKRNIKVKE
ncbi:HAD family phosphatase [Candidatus Marinimicrobia bacterium MT.SAG.3]|nr:HAD family phosphatase [Candidatus Marinimicrobia bacterium MT.SAG.3]